MSAAATAAGYLYASGRLRGKNKDGEGEAHRAAPTERKRVRIAALAERAPSPVSSFEPQVAERPKRVTRVEYRVRRWRPDPE